MNQDEEEEEEQDEDVCVEFVQEIIELYDNVTWIDDNFKLNLVRNLFSSIFFVVVCLTCFLPWCWWANGCSNSTSNFFFLLVSMLFGAQCITIICLYDFWKSSPWLQTTLLVFVYIMLVTLVAATIAVKKNSHMVRVIFVAIYVPAGIIFNLICLELTGRMHERRQRRRNATTTAE